MFDFTRAVGTLKSDNHYGHGKPPSVEENPFKQDIPRLYFDTAEFDKQLDDFLESVSLLFPDGIPDSLGLQLSEVTSDVIFTDCRSTVGADGVTKIVQSFRAGSSLHIFKTALFAGDCEDHDKRTP
jgi:hypothetical protein